MLEIFGYIISIAIAVWIISIFIRLIIKNIRKAFKD